MTRQLFTLALLLCALCTQAQMDTITVIKKGEISTFYKDGYKIGLSDISDLVQSNPVASKQIKSARIFKKLDLMVGIAGASLITIPIVSSFDGTQNWNLAKFGGIIAAFTIPIDAFHKGQTKKAVDTYNTWLKQDVLTQRYKFSWGISPQHAGLTIKF